MIDVMPPQADWLKTKVAEFRPEENAVVTTDGSKVKYDYLIVAVGLKVDFERVRRREGGRDGWMDGWMGDGEREGISVMHIVVSAILAAEQPTVCCGQRVK